MTPDRVAELLGRTAPFAGLDAAPLLALATAASVRTYRRGQYIVAQDDPGDAMFVLISGTVKVLSNSAEGGEVLFCTLGPGDYFGELSFLDGKPRSASVLTAEATQAVALTRAALDRLLDAHPAIARSLLVYLTDMVRRLSEQASDLVFLDLEGRLAKCLDRLAEDNGKVEGDDIRLDLNITQSDLASMVGASRPSVNQALQSFNKRGFVRTEGRTILITDRAALRRRHQR